jgi:hypothetical protein
LINLSDPHGAEFATQQKKQIMREKYVSHIWKKNKLRIGSHIFRNLFLHLQFTQMIARKYKRYIRQFWRKKKKKFVRCKHRPKGSEVWSSQIFKFTAMTGRRQKVYRGISYVVRMCRCLGLGKFWGVVSFVSMSGGP